MWADCPRRQPFALHKTTKRNATLQGRNAREPEGSRHWRNTVKHSYTRSLSLLILIALRSPAAELPFVRGQIRSSTPQAFQGLMVGMEDVISHVQIRRVDV